MNPLESSNKNAILSYPEIAEQIKAKKGAKFSRKGVDLGFGRWEEGTERGS